nr:hypothetical protein [Tanacetum cinerariifolium]
MFGHSLGTCPMRSSETPTAAPVDNLNDGFTKVVRKRNKGNKADQQPKSKNTGGSQSNKPKPRSYRSIPGKDSKNGSSKPMEHGEASKSQVRGVLNTPSNHFDVLNTLNEEDNNGVLQPTSTLPETTGTQEPNHGGGNGSKDPFDRMPNGAKNMSRTGGGKKDLVLSEIEDSLL